MNLLDRTTNARASVKERIAAMVARVDPTLLCRSESDGGDRQGPLTASVPTPTAANGKIATTAADNVSRKRVRPLSLTEQRELRFAQREADARRWETQQLARQRGRASGLDDHLLPVWKLDVIRMRNAILQDTSGRACRIWLERASRLYSGTPIWAAVQGALAIRQTWLNDEGKTVAYARRDWRDEQARNILVVALALALESKPTKRRGMWTRLVRGFSVANFQALLGDPNDKDRRPNRSTLTGTHGPGSVGYMKTLKESGFCYSQQLPASQVEPWEIGNVSGHAFNRYWIVGLAPSPNLETELRLQAWHRAGWDVAQLVVVHAASRAPP